MRNLVNEIAKGGKLSPVLEKKGILGDANDIAVTSSVNASNVESKSPCEAYAQYRKHAKYDKDFKDSETHIFASKHLDACVLQRQIAREIELRTNGQKYQYHEH